MGSQRKNAKTGAAQHSQNNGVIHNPRCLTWDYGGGDFLAFTAGIFIDSYSWFLFLVYYYESIARV